MHLRPAIFLDRDGTLNRQIIRDGKPYPPLSLQEFELLDGAQEACDRLSRAGYALVVATNQPDVARGTQTKKVIESMHARLLELIPSIERIEVCYAPGRKLEHPENHRRKPAPGMLLEAASALQLDLPRSWMIGDRAGDIDAGYAAGCRTIFIDWNYQENPPTHAPHHTVKSLLEAAGIILAHYYPQLLKQVPPKKNHPMKSLSDLKIHLYADGADKAGILELYAKPYIKGLTTNPTLMNKAGIKDYEAFSKDILQSVTAKPISLEVFTDDLVDMKRQALKIASWGENVFVKIPITNSGGLSCLPLIKDLAQEGVKLNITALLTLEQVAGVATALNPQVPSVVSIFAGRIADTGVDPMPIMRAATALLAAHPKAELLWASVREVLNIFQAEEVGCKIVTVPHDILGKAAKMYGMDLTALSLDTVKMFAKDAADAGFKL